MDWDTGTTAIRRARSGSSTRSSSRIPPSARSSRATRRLRAQAACCSRTLQMARRGGSLAMRQSVLRGVAMALVVGLLGACSTAPATPEGKDDLVRRAAAALAAWNREIPGVESFARGSLGYVMFPEITKGGAGLGGAY